ncbi:hypothetical protein FGG22_gp073 [Mycobacterium phage Hammer]|uniref:Uncharacterized protein n=2 Tax=Gladiatorvirus hammer TaxID=1034103 RepID=G8I685_9CAUD|nr:hypothetical protein CL99_gp071 [Mycobacterium phage Blue7]YP_009636558.1 hypothetical protein FGG22_gp073 [Mycobacterium phage Hammer]AEK08688.1 hypothetical protein HAMMER_43 [Mycobacterium phage Hammer]AER48229.1 hypothetical protein BLUE7_44 [Mycobacterium phage Blue7]WRQ08658.1 hypothetical protein JDBV06_00135 [Mycobacterium phage miche]
MGPGEHMVRDYLAEAKNRVGMLSDAEAYALIDIAESLRTIKDYVTAPPIRYVIGDGHD